MDNLQKTPTGLERVLRAASNSINGLKLAVNGEQAFRQELALALVMLPASLWIGRGWTQVALLAGSVLLVLIVELLNSAVEAAIDRISYEFHDLSKRAKDLGSAAVMLALLLCGGIWATALWVRLTEA